MLDSESGAEVMKTFYQLGLKQAELVDPENTLSINQSTCLSLRFEQSFATSGPGNDTKFNFYNVSVTCQVHSNPSEFAPQVQCNIVSQVCADRTRANMPSQTVTICKQH